MVYTHTNHAHAHAHAHTHTHVHMQFNVVFFRFSLFSIISKIAEIPYFL